MPLIPPAVCPSGTSGDDGLTNAPGGGVGVPVRGLSGPARDDGPGNELAGGRGVPMFVPGMCPSGSAGNDSPRDMPDGG